MTLTNDQIRGVIENAGVSYSKTWKVNNRKQGDGSIEDVLNFLAPKHFRNLTRDQVDDLVRPVLEEIAAEQGPGSIGAALWKIFIGHRVAEDFTFLNDGGTLLICRIKKASKHTREVEPLAEPLAAKRELFEALMEINPKYANPKNVKELYDYIELYRSLFKDAHIKYVAEPEEHPSYAAYTYKLIDPVVPSQDTSKMPAWNEFLCRLSDAEAYAAWVWSIYEPIHRGRQMLYLQGVDGEDGKTATTNCHREMFGIKFSAAVLPDALSQDNRFGLAPAFGKRLLIIPDVTNTKLLKYPKLKQILGGDPQPIEWKNQRTITAVLGCRVLAVSNYAIDVENTSYERSRVLWLTVKPIEDKANLDPEWPTKLRQEYPQFLAYAKSCYQKRCPKDYEIESADSKARLEGIISMADEDLEDYVDGVIVPDQNGEVLRHDFNESLRKIKGLNKSDINKIKAIMVQRGFIGFDSDIRNAEHQRIYRGFWLRTGSYSPPSPINPSQKDQKVGLKIVERDTQVRGVENGIPGWEICGSCGAIGDDSHECTR